MLAQRALGHILEGVDRLRTLGVGVVAEVNTPRQIILQQHAPRPYEDTLINGVTGTINVQRSALKALGAVESPSG